MRLAYRGDRQPRLDIAPGRTHNENNSQYWYGIAMHKTLSFAALHFTVAFSVGWLMTGSWMVGGALALVEPACNTVVFHFHEKVWKRIEARRPGGHGPERDTLSL